MKRVYFFLFDDGERVLFASEIKARVLLGCATILQVDGRHWRLLDSLEELDSIASTLEPQGF